MSKKTKIDKTKENIGVTNLDPDEKKQLYNKFIQSGGQIVKERSRRGLSDFDRDKQTNYRSRIDTHRQKLKEKKGAPTTKYTAITPSKKTSTPKKITPSEIRVNPFIRFFHRWRIRFRLFFMGVTDFYGIYFTRRFMERFNSIYKTSLLELQLVYLDIFRKNHAQGILIIDELDSLNPLYFELIDMSASVFDRTLINRIVEHNLHFPDVLQRVTDTREPLMELFKKLYILFPYYEFIVNALERAIILQMKTENGKSSVYSSKRKKIKNDMYAVFYKLFPALYWLFNNYNGFILLLQDPAIAHMLKVSEKDMPGKRERIQKTDKHENDIDNEAGDETIQEKEEIPDEVRAGLDLMLDMNLEYIRSRIKKDDLFNETFENDKIIISYVLFKEFDYEYSFILTTNKIKFNVLFTSEGKVDYKTRLSDLYNDLRKTMNIFKDYSDALKDYEKTRLEKPSSSSQYMDYSNRLSSTDKKRKNVGKHVRMTLCGFMERVADELKKIIDDMNSTQKIIENPQDVLVFESTIEGDKKMNGVKVYMALIKAYNYAIALVHRLSPDGDLFGDIELNEDEIKALNTRESEKPRAAKEARQNEDNSDASIIRELDDLV